MICSDRASRSAVQSLPPVAVVPSAVRQPMPGHRGETTSSLLHHHDDSRCPVADDGKGSTLRSSPSRPHIPDVAFRRGFPQCLKGPTKMIEVENLSKRYGDKLAVDGLSFVVQPGMVTGFLGPNGAGKSTTMRLIAGLDRPTAGRVVVNGGDYRSAAAPMAELGVLLEAKAVHTGRSARNHLLALAQTNGISRKRVDEVIDLVGLREVAGKRVGGFSLGMGQRLGVASALLGDPGVVVLDEPVNGLDPEGVLWIRNTLKALAAEGRTVFVSSHLMSEMAMTATRLVVVGRGELIADTTVDEFIARAGGNTVTVRTPEAAKLRDLLLAPDITVTTEETDVLHVQGLTAEQIGYTAWQAHLPIYELAIQRASLEEAFMELTNDSVDYRSFDANDVA